MKKSKLLLLSQVSLLALIAAGLAPVALGSNIPGAPPVPSDKDKDNPPEGYIPGAPPVGGDAGNIPGAPPVGGDAGSAPKAEDWKAKAKRLKAEREAAEAAAAAADGGAGPSAGGGTGPSAKPKPPAGGAMQVPDAAFFERKAEERRLKREAAGGGVPAMRPSSTGSEPTAAGAPAFERQPKAAGDEAKVPNKMDAAKKAFLQNLILKAKVFPAVGEQKPTLTLREKIVNSMPAGGKVEDDAWEKIKGQIILSYTKATLGNPSREIRDFMDTLKIINGDTTFWRRFQSALGTLQDQVDEGSRNGWKIPQPEAGGAAAGPTGPAKERAARAAGGAPVMGPSSSDSMAKLRAKQEAKAREAAAAATGAPAGPAKKPWSPPPKATGPAAGGGAAAGSGAASPTPKPKPKPVVRPPVVAGLPADFNSAAYIRLSPDLQTYVAEHPADIAAAGGRDQWAMNHYISYGKAEGRMYKEGGAAAAALAPAPVAGLPADFDPSMYLALNKDLQDASQGMSKPVAEAWATQHYLSYGIKEGRAYRAPAPAASAPVAGLPAGFDSKTYVSLNPDLQTYVAEHPADIAAAGGANQWATNHYISNGRAEGRRYK